MTVYLLARHPANICTSDKMDIKGFLWEWKSQLSHWSKLTLRHHVLPDKTRWSSKVNVLECRKNTERLETCSIGSLLCVGFLLITIALIAVLMVSGVLLCWLHKAFSLGMLIVTCISLHAATSPTHRSPFFINLWDISHPTVTIQKTRRLRSKRNPAVSMSTT